jgi:hypothetical protein
MVACRGRAFGFDTGRAVDREPGELGGGASGSVLVQGVDLILADLEPAKILGTQVYGAKAVRIAGSYDQVNRLSRRLRMNIAGIRERTGRITPKDRRRSASKSPSS